MRKTLIGTRRAVIVKGVLGAAGLACGASAMRAHAQARTGSADKVQSNDPVAQSLKYVEDATKAPADVRKPDSFCNNCQLYQADQENGGAAPCMLLMGKLVPAQGWCSGWVMKAAGG